MTKIKYSDSGEWITLRAIGHAGYGPKGMDVVCAAVSALTQTLAGYAAGQDDSEVLCDEASASINITLRHNRKNLIAATVILGGLNAIAEQYPDHVCITK